jgi:hypothetical protein
MRMGVVSGDPMNLKRTMTEDDVLREVQRLVAAGEYLDSMLGVPGAHLTGPGTFIDHQRGRPLPEGLLECSRLLATGVKFDRSRT